MTALPSINRQRYWCTQAVLSAGSARSLLSVFFPRRAAMRILACIVLFGALAVEARPDGTIACDPDLKPYVFNNTGVDLFITTPDFGSSPYEPNLDCEWRINGLDDEVLIDFLSNSVIEDCVDCSCDAVTVYAVNSADEEVLLHTHCGNIEQVELVSGSTTIIRFKSDSVGQGPGFQALISFVDAACEVGGGMPVLETSGFLTSPEFPNNYPNNLVCRWNFDLPADQVLRWEFVTLDTQPGCVTGSGGFQYDFVDVFENDDTSQSLGRWSSTLQSSALAGWEYTSRSNVVSLIFRSDGSNVGGGFNISYSQVPA